MHSRIEIVVTLRTLLVMAVLAAFPSLGFATRIIIGGGDPGAQPIQDVNNVQPGCLASEGGNPLGDTCTYYFENTAGSIVDSFTFETQISLSDYVNNFTGPGNGCLPTNSQGFDPNGYFQNCMVSDIPINSQEVTLVYSFSGVFPPDGDELPQDFPGNDGEIGQYEGIPPDGIFPITLEGWTGDLSSVTINTTYTVAPEPSAALILLTEFLLLAGFLALLGRRLQWNRHFDL